MAWSNAEQLPSWQPGNRPSMEELARRQCVCHIASADELRGPGPSSPTTNCLSSSLTSTSPAGLTSRELRRPQHRHRVSRSPRGYLPVNAGCGLPAGHSQVDRAWTNCSDRRTPKTRAPRCHPHQPHPTTTVGRSVVPRMSATRSDRQVPSRTRVRSTSYTACPSARTSTFSTGLARWKSGLNRILLIKTLNIEISLLIRGFGVRVPGSNPAKAPRRPPVLPIPISYAWELRPRVAGQAFSAAGRAVSGTTGIVNSQ